MSLGDNRSGGISSSEYAVLNLFSATRVLEERPTGPPKENVEGPRHHLNVVASSDTTLI
jgi:hypothetical protein